MSLDGSDLARAGGVWRTRRPRSSHTERGARGTRDAERGAEDAVTVALWPAVNTYVQHKSCPPVVGMPIPRHVSPRGAGAGTWQRAGCMQTLIPARANCNPETRPSPRSLSAHSVECQCCKRLRLLGGVRARPARRYGWLEESGRWRPVADATSWTQRGPPACHVCYGSESFGA